MMSLITRTCLGIGAGLLVFLSSCTSLPETMPTDFSLTLDLSGGMMPIAQRLTLSAAGGRFVKHYYAGEDHQADVNLPFVAADLKALYQVVRAHRFEAIRTHNELIYDRGGESLSITYGGQTITVVNGGMTIIDSPWQADWTAIRDAVVAVRDRLVAAASVAITFELSPAARDLADLSIQVDMDSLYYAPTATGSSVTGAILPGNYILAIRAGQSRYQLRREFRVTGPQAFRVDLVQNELVLD